MRVHACLAAAAVLVFGRALGWADGKTFAGYDYGALRPVGQHEQVAAILHRDGVEKLIIAVNFDLDAKEKALWIFPVPGTPDRTKIDVVDSFPRFAGINPWLVARRALSNFVGALQATQIYPVLIEGCLASLGRARVGLSVHEQVGKWGIRSEAVTAGSLADLVEHLQQQGATVPEAELRVFEPYLTDNWVLVLAWISSREELLQKFPDYGKRFRGELERHPCLYVEFPTERAFYPLKPTSGYGSEFIPVRLYVVGCVQPVLPEGLKYRTRVRLFRQRRVVAEVPEAFVESLPGERFFYTAVEITADASDYTEDLWFAPQPRRSTAYADAVLALSHRAIAIPLTLVTIVVLSYVTAGLCGLALYGQWKGYARVGLWNLLTLVGLIFAIRHVPGERGEKLRASFTKGALRIKFWHLFTLFYLALSIVLRVLLFLPLQ